MAPSLTVVSSLSDMATGGTLGFTVPDELLRVDLGGRGPATDDRTADARPDVFAPLDWRAAVAAGVWAGAGALSLALPPGGRALVLLALIAVAIGGVLWPGRPPLGPTIQRLSRSSAKPVLTPALAAVGFEALALPVLAASFARHTEVPLAVAVAVVVAVMPLVVARSNRTPRVDVAAGGAAASLIFAGAALGLGGIWIGALGLGAVGLGGAIGWMTALISAVTPADQRRTAVGLAGLVAVGWAVTALAAGDAIASAWGRAAPLFLAAPGALAAAGLLFVGRGRLVQDAQSVVEEAAALAASGSSSGRGSALEVRRLCFSYGTHQVLFDLSLSVPEGEVAALLGTNGAGKSTLLRAVAGLDHPTRGTIRLFEQDTTYLEAEQILDQGVALLAGGRMTFPSLSVIDNLRAGGRPRGRAAIDDALGTFPALTPKLAQRAGTLSGGEQQMLALARVLLARPRLLLIDELTLGLAPKIVQDLLAIVRRINEDGATVLIVEQSVNLALALAGHAFFLERGEVRFDGRTSDLLARDDLLRPVFLTEPGSR